MSTWKVVRPGHDSAAMAPRWTDTTARAIARFNPTPLAADRAFVEA